VAGGGQYFTQRGMGDFLGFIAGSALILDYTIDIALFAVACTGYANFFLPYLGYSLGSFVVPVGPFHVNWFWLFESLAVILLLIWLNIKGIKESSRVNEWIGVLIIIAEMVLILVGFLFAWKPEYFVQQWTEQAPTLNRFAYGSSLAIISFVGLESISQAAQETRRPATIVPRTSIGLIFSVFLFATGLSLLANGVVPWQEIAAHVDNPVAVLARALPLVGEAAGPITAVLGALILFISANSGIMSVSRVTYGMSQFGEMSEWFQKVHPKHRTPVRTILVFSGIGLVQTIVAFLTPNVMDTLGNMYAFGASLGYTLVFMALIRLRFTEPHVPRPYLMPFNIPLPWRGRRVQFPVLGLLGMAGVMLILVEVVWTHEIGRIAGPAWVICCLAGYFAYRRKMGMPLLGSVKRNWEEDQMRVLEEAEEFDLLEQYKNSLASERRWQQRKGRPQ
jgi:APA family basic amino acid/polyamine antiporter